MAIITYQIRFLVSKCSRLLRICWVGKSHTTVVVMETELGSLIDPKERIAWNSSVEPSPPTSGCILTPNVIVSRDGSGDLKTILEAVASVITTTTIISNNLGRLEYPKSTTAATATFYNKFVNTAGPEKFQAVAFHSKSNHSTLFRCAFYGYQDTLYVHVGEQLYKGYDIIGTMDFIFGNAAAVFQMCTTVIAGGGSIIF
ncbi:hypothetical protein YC2023_005934 [Brassica napus]